MAHIENASKISDINARDRIVLLSESQYYNLELGLIIIKLVVCAVGIFNNLTSLYVFIKMSLAESVTLLFFSLAIVDLEVVVSILVVSISSLLSHLERVYKVNFLVDPFVLWVYSSLVLGMVYIANILVTSLLSVVRCLCVAKPLHFRNMFSMKLTLFLVSICIAIGVSCHMSAVVTLRTITITDSNTSTTRIVITRSSITDVDKYGDILSSAVLPIVAQATILVCLAILFNALQEASKFRHASKLTLERLERQDSNARLSLKHTQAVKQVAFVAGVFVICNFPNIVIVLTSELLQGFNIGKIYSNIYRLSMSAQLVLQATNSTVNFYIYLAFNTKFREMLLSTCRSVA